MLVTDQQQEFDMPLTDEQREKRNAYHRQWKKNNKDKVNAQNRKTRASNPEKYREINRRSIAKMRALNPEHHNVIRYRYIAKNTPALLWRRAKKRADEQGLPFNIEPSDVVVPEFCPVLGIKLECDVGRRLSHNRTSPSLDRIKPEKGYVKGNVRVISNRANHLKNNGTLEEFRRIVAYLELEEMCG